MSEQIATDLLPDIEGAEVHGAGNGTRSSIYSTNLLDFPRCERYIMLVNEFAVFFKMMDDLPVAPTTSTRGVLWHYSCDEWGVLACTSTGPR